MTKPIKQVQLDFWHWVVLRGVELHPPRASIADVRATLRELSFKQQGRRVREALKDMEHLGLVEFSTYRAGPRKTDNDRWSRTDARARPGPVGATPERKRKAKP